jgi:hypothetical protein
MALAGDPREIDPVRRLSPRHGAVADIAGEKTVAADNIEYRRRKFANLASRRSAHAA